MFVVPPRLRLLGYTATRPHLRLIRLPEADFEPAPVALDRGRTALDRSIRRDGWIAFHSEDVWGVPIPLEGKAFRVGESFVFLPSLNPRSIWIQEGFLRDEDAQAYVEYDGVARQIVARVVLPAGARLMRETDVGLIAHEYSRGWSRWERGGAAGEPIGERDALSPGLLVGFPEEPAIVDAERNVRPLDNSLGGRWEGRSLSPDGRYLAVDVDVSGPREHVSMVDIVQGRVEYTPRPHRLALVDCVTASVTLVDGVFDNFASPPVWSDDSEWLVFAAPFTPRGLWTCRVADARLQWVDFGRNTPVPLVNVSDLIDESV